MIAPIVAGVGEVEIVAAPFGQGRRALAVQGCPATRRVSERRPGVGPSCVVCAGLQGHPGRTRLDGLGATQGDGGSERIAPMFRLREFSIRPPSLPDERSGDLLRVEIRKSLPQGVREQRDPSSGWPLFRA